VNDTREGLADRGREWKTKLLDWEAAFGKFKLTNDAFLYGVYFGKVLRDETPPPPGCTRRRRSNDPWEVLARLWVQTLLYAAPYGDVEAHRQHLSQGGEFITHLWALLYHLRFDKWEHVTTRKRPRRQKQKRRIPRRFKRFRPTLILI
jgi:hypothetical protein